MSSSAGHHGSVTPERRGALRGGLAVVVVEVPLPAGRLAAVEQHAVRLPRAAVEVLHQQPLAAAPLGPALEVLAGGREAARRQHRAAESLDQPERGVRRRVHDLDVAGRRACERTTSAYVSACT